MSTTVCASTYEYQGQVYSPAFSEPSSPMSTSSQETSSQPSSPKRRDFEDFEEEEFVSKRPKFANKYEEMLQPICPVKTLPSFNLKKHRLPKKTHVSDVDVELQDQFHNLISVAALTEVNI